MIKRIFAFAVFALAFGAASVVQPAIAQQPSARAVEMALSDMSAWMGEYYAVSQSTPLDVEGYLDVLNRLDEGKLGQGEAVAAMEVWRDRALAANADARRSADLLRAPPSMAAVGPGGDRLDLVLRASSDGLRPMLDAQRQMIERLGELGVHAIRDPSSQADTRVRAVIESQLQVLAGAERRVRISLAALSEDHPNHAVFAAALAFYEAMEAISRNQLEALDGGGDSQLLTARLRQSASTMRRETARGVTLAEQLLQAARWQQAPENARMASVIVRMAQTFPELLGYYTQLAEALDRAATKIEVDQDVATAWADLETETEAPLENIARLDRERAAMMGQGRPPT